MIFKDLLKNEEHSNLLILAQDLTKVPTNIFPEKFMFYIFSSYCPFSLIFEIRSKRKILVRTRINGKISDVAFIEYLNNGEPVIVADDYLFDTKDIQPVIDALINTAIHDKYTIPANSSLTIPYFGKLDLLPSLIPSQYKSGDLELCFHRYHNETDWKSIILPLMLNIETLSIECTHDNINSLKSILSTLLVMDIIDEDRQSFMGNIIYYRKIIEMLDI
jgi:hypothetical protein